MIKEYSTKFNNLASYAPEIASIEIGQIEKFMYGYNRFTSTLNL